MYRCVRRFRNKSNVIVGYRLIDSSGKTKDVGADALKKALRNNVIQVSNLSLTTDNRIISLNIKDTIKKQSINHKEFGPFEVTQELIDSLNVLDLKFKVVTDRGVLEEIGDKIRYNTLGEKYQTKVLSDYVYFIRNDSIGEIISGREIIMSNIQNNHAIAKTKETIHCLIGDNEPYKLIDDTVMVDVGKKLYLCIKKSNILSDGLDAWLAGDVWIQWKNHYITLKSSKNNILVKQTNILKLISMLKRNKHSTLKLITFLDMLQGGYTGLLTDTFVDKSNLIPIIPYDNIGIAYSFNINLEKLNIAIGIIKIDSRGEKVMDMKSCEFMDIKLQNSLTEIRNDANSVRGIAVRLASKYGKGTADKSADHKYISYMNYKIGTDYTDEDILELFNNNRASETVAETLKNYMVTLVFNKLKLDASYENINKFMCRIYKQEVKSKRYIPVALV